MLHFCFSSAVYEPTSIIFSQRLLPFCFAGILKFAREIFFLLFVYCHVGKLYLARRVKSEFSTKYTRMPSFRDRHFVFYQIAAVKSAGSNVPNFWRCILDRYYMSYKPNSLWHNLAWLFLNILLICNTFSNSHSMTLCISVINGTENILVAFHCIICVVSFLLKLHEIVAR